MKKYENFKIYIFYFENFVKYDKIHQKHYYSKIHKKKSLWTSNFLEDEGDTVEVDGIHVGFQVGHVALPQRIHSMT